LNQGQAKKDESHRARNRLGQGPIEDLRRRAVPQEQILLDTVIIPPQTRQALLLLTRQLGKELLEAA